jgi:CRP-like cAMP-binding protein
MLDANSRHKTLLEVFRKGTRLAYKKGEFIIRPGETPSGVFYIQQGLVKAYDITKYGEENLLTFRKTEEIFPLIWAFTGQGRNVIYETLSPTVVWRLDRIEFLEHVKKDNAVLQQALDVILEMYRIHSERIMNLEYRTVRERLISFLLIMSQRFGEVTKDGVLIDVPIKQQDIASSINSSRETTGRELSRLEKKGLVINKKSCIILVDIEKLRSFL